MIAVPSTAEDTEKQPYEVPIVPQSKKNNTAQPQPSAQNHAARMLVSAAAPCGSNDTTADEEITRGSDEFVRR